jgi:hypothetical protein
MASDPRFDAFHIAISTTIALFPHTPSLIINIVSEREDQHPDRTGAVLALFTRILYYIG